MTSLPRSTPAAQGVDANGIDAFVAALGRAPNIEPHGLMVLRHGHVVAERWWHPYGPGTPHLLYSLSKAFASTALGFAVAEAWSTWTPPCCRTSPSTTPGSPIPAPGRSWYATSRR